MDLKVFSASACQGFAQNVAQLAGVELGKMRIGRFADGEVEVRLEESVRGAFCFVLQSTCPPVNENYMELFVILDALKRSSCSHLVAVLPYFGYARQDHKRAYRRAPISAKCMSDLLLTAGATSLVCIDLHSPQTQGFFNAPVEHLGAGPVLAQSWKERFGCGDGFVVVSPDAGGVERVRNFAKRLECSLAIVDKRRPRPNEVEALHLVGDVKDKHAILLDDLIDTAGTVCLAADLCLEKGAKEVSIVATHGIFSGAAFKRLKQSGASRIMITDTVPLKAPADLKERFDVVSVAPLVAKAILRISTHKSLGPLFDA